MKEIWKDIPGYEGLYQISNLGNIYIIKRKKKKIKTINKDGYYYVDLSKNNHKEKIDKIIDYLDKNEVNEKLKKDIFHILSS